MKKTDDKRAEILQKAVIEAGKVLIPPFVLLDIKNGISGLVDYEGLGRFAINLRRAEKDEDLVDPVYNPRAYAMEFANWYNEKRSFIELNKMSMESAMIEFQLNKKYNSSNIPNTEDRSPAEG